MKVRLNFLVISFIGCIILFSCKDDDDNSCRNEYVEYRNIEDFSNCQETLWNITLNTTENYVIVHNQQEFEQFVNTLNCSVEIDFGLYDLIIGSHYISPEADFDYEVIDNCAENKLYILVRIMNSQSSEIEEKAVFQVLVPKLRHGETVQINFAT